MELSYSSQRLRNPGEGYTSTDAGILLPEPNTRAADDLISRTQRYRSHPWAMIEEGLVWTLDSTNLRDPIRKFPADPWLRDLTDVWVRSPLFACPKSRRMMVSWLMVWNHLHLTMFNPGAHVYFQSETQEKSDELVDRAYFMYSRIPDERMIRPRLRNNKKMECLLDFEKLFAFIKGIPQGANQLRQYTATAVLMDEAAFWEKGRESFASTKPTIEGGGRVTLISSAQKGWYRDVCFDTID
jgi:hypothetical protein